MSVAFFPTPMPVVIRETKQEAYAIYLESGGQFENDIWTCVLCESGEILTCTIKQLTVHNNATYSIKKQ